MMRVFKVPKYFDFNCGPKWSAIIHWRGYGIGIRHDYNLVRILLLFWHVIIRLNKPD